MRTSVLTKKKRNDGNLGLKKALKVEVLEYHALTLSLSPLISQYDDVLEMLESMERMNLLGIYKKTRPALPYSETKAW